MHVLDGQAPGSHTGHRLKLFPARTRLQEPGAVSTAAPEARSLPPPELVALAVLVTFGLVARIWVLVHPLGALDSDEAVIGLIGLHLLHGHHLPTFFWGQNYGGPHEAVLAALLFAVMRPSPLVLKSIPVLLSAVAAVLTWRIARIVVGERAGRWAGAIFWAAPAAFVWWSTKASVYWGSLTLALVVLLLLCRNAQRSRDGAHYPPWREAGEAALLGFATGMAFWANPQTLYVMVPAYLWYAPGILRRWRSLPVIGATALLGAAPWIRYNLIHHWVSFQFAPQPAVAGGYAGRLRQFFQIALPMALGLKVPYTRAWVFGALGLGVVVALLALFVFGAFRLPAPARLLVFLVAVYPFLFAYSPYSWYVDHPRYLLFLAPSAAILLGAAMARRPLVGAVAGGIVVALSAFGLAAMNSSGKTAPYGPDVLVPANLAPLDQLLTRYHVRYAFADYWLAYRTTFETREATLVSPTYVVRDPGIDARVRAAPIPDYLFLAASRSLPIFQTRCASLGVPVAVHRSGQFALVVPAKRVLPEDVQPAWQP
ncbi:MAG TPA: hypothetical protein VG779_06730 [Actinomycetota bacterium]|nr:hypothetical protein [Actinomycetota bacterium]